MNKLLVFDLFCGLGGWSEAFIAEGYHAVGFDIEKHDYGTGVYPGEFVLCDVRSISGADLVKQYGIPTCIVASPPCQEFSYMAMPWSKAKDKIKKILADPQEKIRLTELFNQCFRVQHEVSAAVGRYIPLIVENVRGAQRWVGKSRWNFGSFHLWGDVPALMPIPSNAVLQNGIAHRSNGETNFHGYKTRGLNWSDRTKRGQDFTRVAGKQAMEGGKGMNIAMKYSELKDAIGTKGYATRRGESQVSQMYSSKSKARKEASAMIAKIPFPLANWIARVFKNDLV